MRVPHLNDLPGILLTGSHRYGRVTHVESIPARVASAGTWPEWVDPVVRERFIAAGIVTPWKHQAQAASIAWLNESVIISTGTASGKSLAYLMPALTAARTHKRHGGKTLYLSPTKALAADQLRAIDALQIPDIGALTYDGDTPIEVRDVVRTHAKYLLTNPDMVHRSILPGHHRWAGFLRTLRFVVVDECHGYRGVFGSHVSHVLRRLRRVCAVYHADPTFILASATTADPARTAELLTGKPVKAVTEDGSPRGSKTFLLWQPPMSPSSDELPPHRPGLTGNEPTTGKRTRGERRGVLAETADLLADLVAANARTVAFVRSRRAAETVASMARAALASVDPTLSGRVAAYRAGYLAHERRHLEAALDDGTLCGIAATTALELGIDVNGLDAVLIAGWPGTRSSLWQQAGRAGRSGRTSLAVLLASDDPFDSYFIHHPEAIFGQPVEATVLDPDNPHVLAPHLCAAALERPLTRTDAEVFGPSTSDVLHTLEHQRLLRRRSKTQPSWHWTKRQRPSDLADLRGSGEMINLIERGTGRVLGTVDSIRAHSTAHPGAVYVHQGETYVVDSLDLDENVAIAEQDLPDYTTTARDVSTLRVLDETSSVVWGPARLTLGTVEVTNQVVSYVKRAIRTGEVLGEVAVELPERKVRTHSVWWTLPDEAIRAAGVDEAAAAGSAHAAEHASLGMLPLVASCDRWDVGGLSTVAHPDTGMLTVFVHDGYPGGVGFAERGFRAARTWLEATREAIATCPCVDGCPSCVQSPKCGNGNDPLNKAGAVGLLETMLRDAI
jgi:DEAD/DEAH box helicase domain-containing protein